MAENDLRENPFRDEIYDYLFSHGYVAGQKADYDYKHALDTGKLFEFLEATQAKPKKQVFVMQFAIGEFDMVVFDPLTSCCEIYEIKHSAEIVPEQIRHLVDEEKCRMTEHRFGTITGKYVIYRGPAEVMDDVRYLNVEEYLCRLK